MVRRKIKIKRIENETTRQVTFWKRRIGLLKKAHDLSVLCDAEMGVILFSNKGKLFQFANPSMKTVLERYVKVKGNADSPDNNSSTDIVEIDWLAQFTGKLKSLQSNVLGDALELLSLRDLIHLEQQIDESLGRIRARKEELIVDQFVDFKHKVGETARTKNANSSILDRLVDFRLSDETGRGRVNCERGPASESPQFDASPARVDTSEQSHYIPECLPVAKRLGIIEDLNQLPVCNE